MDQKCSFTVTVSLKHSHFKNYSFCAFINLGRPQTKGVCWTGLPRPEEDSHIHKEQGNFQRDTMPTRQAATMVTWTHNTENIPHNSQREKHKVGVTSGEGGWERENPRTPT